jgi:WD40 repeat protein
MSKFRNRLANPAFALLSFVILAVAPSADAAKGGNGNGNGGGSGGDGGETANPSFVYSTSGRGSVIRIMNEDGSDDQLLSNRLSQDYDPVGTAPTWSPAGDEVAWVDAKYRKPSGLFVYPLDGQPFPAGDKCAGQTRCLLLENSDGLRVTGPRSVGDPVDWEVSACNIASIPTGPVIAFIGVYGEHPNNERDLYVVGRNDPSSLANPVNLAPTVDESINAIAFSPDGGRLAYFAFDDSGSNTTGYGIDGRIDIIDLCAPGLPVASIILPVTTLDSDSPIQRVRSIDWSPTGANQLLVTGGEGVWVVDFTVSPEDPVITAVIGLSGISAPIQTGFDDIIDAAWSPTGNRIAVALQDYDTGIKELVIIDPSADAIEAVITKEDLGRIDWRMPVAQP